ncbi:SPFH domain-containing protein [Capnocytophaga cynodegmi]|uniref:SPFH domain-containing protein n=1 Tax=Capnocytophaga cynodegmi TaxID=28189 RepID=UPI00385E5A30
MSNPDSKLPYLEIIEWVEHTPNLLMWKVPDQDKEIKNGAKLIVRESQSVLFLNEGSIADIFSAGTHSLSTQNIPILSKLRGWKYGFESPFKADVYYFSTKQFVNLKWGTPAPVLMRDPQFGQVRVRAFGSYNVKITDVSKFFKEYAGTYPTLTIFELETQLRDFIAPKFGETLSNANLSVVDVAGNMTELSNKIRPMIEPYFSDFGIEVTQFTISSVTLPQEVTEFYDKATSMNIIGDMNRFQQFNTANAIGNDRSNLNSSVKEGVAMGMIMGTMQQQIQQNQPTTIDDLTTKLQKLKTLFENGLINEEEYKTKKAEILANF